MSGSDRCLGVLESLRELFVNYPCRAEMASVHIAFDPTGRASVLVQLRDAAPAVLSAGVVEWRRTLAMGGTWAWRNPDGTHIHVATTGYPPEDDEMLIAVLAGPVPQDCHLDLNLGPDATAEVDDETLYRWLGHEVTDGWPFQPAGTG